MPEKKWTMGLILILLSLPCSAGRWSDRGPDLGGRLSAIAAHPSNPNVLLVSSPGGGVWRTTDGGASWHQPGNYGLGDYSVVHLEWDLIRGGRLYASTYSDLYATTDLGEHWTNVTRLGGHPAPLMPEIHPPDPKPFAQLHYGWTASTVLWSKPCSGLFYSYDGATFTQHWPFAGGPANPDNCIGAIAADPATGRVYLATLASGGPAHVFRSRCAWTAAAPCLSWENANAGLPEGTIVSDIAWGRAADRLALALESSSSTGIYTSVDGVSWNPAPSQPPALSWTPRSLLSPAPNQLLLGAISAYSSSDWGERRAWVPVWITLMHVDVRGLHWAPYPNGGFLWATTDGAGATGTEVNLARWSFTPGSDPTDGIPLGRGGLKVWQPFYMAATGAPGGGRRRIFLGSVDNGSLCSDDGGATWTAAGAPPSEGCGDYPSLVFAPGNPDRAYSRTCAPSAFARSDNAFSAPSCAEVTWTALPPKGGHYLPGLWTRAMTAVDPANPDRVVFARGFDVGVSRDGGVSWTNHALPGRARPVSVHVQAGGAILAGTLDRGVYRSTDDGVTWEPFGLNAAAPKAVLRIAHSPAGGGEGTWFLATTGGLYRKLPGGAFTLQTGDPSYTVSDVEVDPTCPVRVYASLGYAGHLGQHRGGVLVSGDNGTTFASLTSGLDIHQAPIADIQVDPADARFLHAAVYGLGAWTYDSETQTCP